QAGALSASDPGVIDVGGTTSLTAATFIDLDNHANAFTGTVTASAPGHPIILDATGHLTLGTTTASQLSVATDGVLDQSGPLTVSGESSFTGSTITLTNAANALQNNV